MLPRRTEQIGVTIRPVCAEPTNVQAGGHACRYRFRCVGCDLMARLNT
jgi:hypothetical protein